MAPISDKEKQRYLTMQRLMNEEWVMIQQKCNFITNLTLLKIEHDARCDNPDCEFTKKHAEIFDQGMEELIGLVESWGQTLHDARDFVKKYGS